MRKNLIVGASMLMAALLLLNVVPPTSAAPINPSTVWGEIFVGATNQTSRQTMKVWIDGVSYGTNQSWNGGAGTWYVANMVCAGDDLSYVPKEGGLNGDLMYYQLVSQGPYFSTQAYTFTSGVTTPSIIFNHNTADQPVWGKINEVVNNYWATDYVYLYFPSVPNLANYRLEDNAAWTSATLDTLSTHQMTELGESNIWFVNLTAAGYNLPAVGSLKLAWRGTTTAGGNWVAIDRVEFGQTSATAGPANTIHADYAAGTGIASGTSAKRTTNGTDTDSSLADFTQNLPHPTYPYILPPPTKVPTQNAQLWVEKDRTNGHNILHWSASVSAYGNSAVTEYRVYATNDRFTWNFAAPIATVAAPTLTYTHTGKYADGLSWFYIVRAASAAGVNTTNSGRYGNMAYEYEIAFDYDAARQNKAWISIPWRNAAYSMARATILDMNEGSTAYPNCRVLAKWVVTSQATVQTSWSGAMWLGADYAITSGGGYYTTLLRDFTWHVNGTSWGKGPIVMDYDAARQNKNWISIQYETDNTMARAFILDDLNNNVATYPNARVLAKWVLASQATVQTSWSGAMWLGADYALVIGVGHYTTMLVDFNWANDPYVP